MPETLTVSLPDAETKAALGVKTAGKYPTIWQEGDCLQLNGYSSLPLAAESAGGSSAGFIFRDGLASPFNVLYPVSGEKDLVVFPDMQCYVAGSFDPQASPMWGTSNSYTDIALRHLSSLVRISISSEQARTLKGITLTALGGEHISGSFRMEVDENGAFTGKLVAEDGAPELSYSFGEEGVLLGPGETVVAYISIPVGNYSQGFKAVVKSAAYEYRLLNFFSAGRNVNPGKVLEFPDKKFEDCFAVWEYYVSADGSGDGYSEDTPMSIAKMIELLQEPAGGKIDQATFHFTAGTHTLSSPIILPGKDTYQQTVSYTLTGDDQATLSGGRSSQIFVVKADNSHVTVKDLVLTNGSATLSGGLVSIQEAGPLFEHCSFTHTTTDNSGGAVRISGEGKGNGRFKDCSFVGNKGTLGGAVVITNANTVGTFTHCTFSGNTGNSGGVLYCTNGITTMENCILDGNNATSGGAICATAGAIRMSGCTISGNTASSEGGAIYSADKQKPVFYLNACSLTDNKASKNGYTIYLNSSTAGNFASLCMNNCTVYNQAGMEGTNGSAVCNKGKSLILNSTFYGTTTKWGTFALGVHKNHGDVNGCLLLNSIFVNTAAGKPAIYQTGSNYYAIAKNCIASVTSDNSQFTQTDVIHAVPALSWNGRLFTWNGDTTLPHLDKAGLVAELSGESYQLAAGFVSWLKSLKYNVNGTEYDALDVDQSGNLRSIYSWAGAYQK